MLQSDHRPTRSLYAVPATTPQKAAVSSQHLERSLSPAALEQLRHALPETLTANKRAVINRLIALHEQGAIG